MSRGHLSEELHQLLRGDLPNDEMLVVTDHLRDCESCRGNWSRSPWLTRC